MKPVRVAVAAIVGAVAIFAWGALSHMLLPLGEMGVRSLPSEDVLVAAMKGSMHERGFYMFPGIDPADMADAAKAKAWEDRYRSGPRGVVVFDPSGGPAMSADQLGSEFVGGLIAAVIVALAMSRTSCGLVGRAMLGGMLGVFAWASIDISYWTWYRFPTDLLLAGLIDQAVGWFITGLIMALIIGKPGAASPPTT